MYCSTRTDGTQEKRGVSSGMAMQYRAKSASSAVTVYRLVEGHR